MSKGKACPSHYLFLTCCSLDNTGLVNKQEPHTRKIQIPFPQLPAPQTSLKLKLGMRVQAEE